MLFVLAVDLCGGSVPERAVGSGPIVVQPPGLDELARVSQAEEPVLVQALVPQPSVEALHERVLDGLAGRDEVQLDARRVRPLIEHPTGQFGAIVQHQLPWGAAFAHHLSQYLDDPLPGQRGIDLDGQGLAGERVQYGEQADPSPPRQRVTHEVEAPLHIRATRPSRRSAWDSYTPLPATPTHGKSRFAVQPLHPLVVDRVALPLQQHVQTTIAEPPPFPGQLAQALPQGRVVCAGMRLIARGRAPHPYQTTSPPLGDAALYLELLHGAPPTHRAHQPFPSSSLSIWLSRACSATSRLSRAFSSSSALSRVASTLFRPPYFCFQR